MLNIQDLHRQNLLTLPPEVELEDWIEKLVKKERLFEVRGQGAGFIFRVKVVRRIRELVNVCQGPLPRPHFMSSLRVFFFHLMVLYYLDAAKCLGEARWVSYEGGWPGTLEFYEETSLRPVFREVSRRLTAHNGKLPDQERVCGSKKMRVRDCKELELREWNTSSFDLLDLFDNERESAQASMYKVHWLF